MRRAAAARAAPRPSRTGGRGAPALRRAAGCPTRPSTTSCWRAPRSPTRGSTTSSTLVGHLGRRRPSTSATAARLAAALGGRRPGAIRGLGERRGAGAALRRADLFLCLSDHEGFCVPLIEAMAAGLPIVAYASSAIPETARRRAACCSTRSRPRWSPRPSSRPLANPALAARMAAGAAPSACGAARAEDAGEPAGRASSRRSRDGPAVGATACPPPLARALRRGLERLERWRRRADVVVAAGARRPAASRAGCRPAPGWSCRPSRAAPGRPGRGPAALGGARSSCSTRRRPRPSAAASRCPVVVAGLPRPAAGGAEARALDAGAGTSVTVALWRAEVARPVPPDGPGVAWVGGAARRASPPPPRPGPPGARSCRAARHAPP